MTRSTRFVEHGPSAPLIIYGLIDPRTRLVRYIGQSSVGIRRPRDHAKPAVLARNQNYSGNWIRELVRAGLQFEIVVLETLDCVDQLDAAECWWIAYGRASGWPLTNLSTGGHGARGVQQTIESRAKRSIALRGRIRTAEHCQRLSEAKKEAWARNPEAARKKGEFLKQWNSDPVNQARRASRISTTLSTDEARKRASEWSRRVWADPEIRARAVVGRRERRLGKKHSQETKNKIGFKARVRQLQKQLRSYLRTGGLL